MKGIIVRTLIIALGIWVADKLVPGVYVGSGVSLVFAAIALGLVNALIRPLIVLLTLPFTLVTLGLFLLVVNAAMLQLADWFVSGFSVDGFFSAVFGSIVISLVSWAASSFVGPQGRYEVMVRRERL
ncbi:MAG: phage holin family protein [Gammaproteobacteria bacterium]|nr:phage holin family protein [Gammaproteobacteria bacterium]MDE0364012.1 phage holin family protein [Gammaproteobacteria bacterium]